MDSTTWIAAFYGQEWDLMNQCFPFVIKRGYKKLAGKVLHYKPKLCILPPTTKTFEDNVNRAHLQAWIWMSTLQNNLSDIDACDHGCVKDEHLKTLQPLTVTLDTKVTSPEVLK